MEPKRSSGSPLEKFPKNKNAKRKNGSPRSGGGRRGPHEGGLRRRAFVIPRWPLPHPHPPITPLYRPHGHRGRRGRKRGPENFKKNGDGSRRRFCHENIPTENGPPGNAAAFERERDHIKRRVPNRDQGGRVCTGPSCGDPPGSMGRGVRPAGVGARGRRSPATMAHRSASRSRDRSGCARSSGPVRRPARRRSGAAPLRVARLRRGS
jgi:hypothetical protein